MEFTPNAVEEAIKAMNDPQQTQAVEFLNVWANIPESVFHSLELLQNSEDANVKRVCLHHLNRNISKLWTQIPEVENKKAAKEILSTLTLNYEENDLNLKLFAKILAQIAAFEWPEEWPEFSELFFVKSDDAPPHVYLNSLKIIRYFFKEIETSKNITTARKKALIDLTLTHTAKFVELVVKFTENPNFSNDALSIYQYLLIWSSMEDAFSPAILERILSLYLLHEETCSKSIACLSVLFLNRLDSPNIFQLYAPIVVQVLSTGTFPNQQSIVSNDKVMDFLIRFLIIYSNIFEIALSFQFVSSNEEYSFLIDENVLGLMNTFQTNQIQPADFQAQLINLYHIILSIPEENVKSIFWQLWCEILQRLRFEITLQQNNGPTSVFFQPIMQNIIESLFNVLESATDENSNNLYNAKTAFECLLAITPELFSQFLISQPPSINLCIAIGMLENHFSSDENAQSLSPVFYEILNANSQDGEYTSMLLTSLAHAAYLLQTDSELFSKFITLVIECLNESEDVATAAVSALNYLNENHADIFAGDSKALIELIVENSEMYTLSLSRDNSTTMFRICSELINKYYPEPQAIYTKLLSPCLPILTQSLELFKSIAANPEQKLPSEPAKDGDDKGFPFMLEKQRIALQNAVLAIVEVGTTVEKSVNYYYDAFWPILYESTILLVTNTYFSNEAIDLYYSADIVLQSYVDREKVNVAEQINEFIQMMLGREKLEESFFDYFSGLMMYDEADYQFIIELFPQIYSQFIEPCLKAQTDDDVPIHAVFRLLGMFTVEFYPTFLPFIINGILDNRDKISRSALQCLNNFLNKFTPEQIPSLASTEPESNVIAALIQIITDEMHRPVLLFALDIFQKILKITSGGAEIMHDVIAISLASCMEEPSPDFFSNFATYIITSSDKFYQFRKAFFNLLIAMKKVCPGDLHQFDVNPIDYKYLFAAYSDAMPPIHMAE